jgi:hypothetical protein
MTGHTLLGAMSLSLAAVSALAAPRNLNWSLRTDDTEIRLALLADAPCIQSLRSQGDRHEWMVARLP